MIRRPFGEFESNWKRSWPILISRYSPTGQGNFSSNLCVQTGSGDNPASCTVGTGDVFLEAKAWPERNADHSPPFSAEDVNE
jgi:hypothetical protein